MLGSQMQHLCHTNGFTSGTDTVCPLVHLCPAGCVAGHAHLTEQAFPRPVPGVPTRREEAWQAPWWDQHTGARRSLTQAPSTAAGGLRPTWERAVSQLPTEAWTQDPVPSRAAGQRESEVLPSSSSARLTPTTAARLHPPELKKEQGRPLVPVASTAASPCSALHSHQV